MSLDAFLQAHKLPASYQHSAQQWFMPIVEKIASHRSGANEPYILGIQGCQGSGKSTLADYIAYQLTHIHKLKVAVCSLDDFYLSHEQRTKLADNVHPLLQTRGVPGTHDTALLEQVLLHINQPNTLSPLTLPRFDKSTDNPHPRASWPVLSMPIDVFIIEGWCWGLPAQPANDLAKPINELEKQHDKAGKWRTYVNQQLSNAYEPLYGFVDQWVLLKAPSFEQVATWREEQEAKLRAKHGTHQANIMNPQQVQEFIAYFQRLTEHALRVMPSRCDWVFELNKSRTITSCIPANGELT